MLSFCGRHKCRQFSMTFMCLLSSGCNCITTSSGLREKNHLSTHVEYHSRPEVHTSYHSTLFCCLSFVSHLFNVHLLPHKKDNKGNPADRYARADFFVILSACATRTLQSLQCLLMTFWIFSFRKNSLPPRLQMLYKTILLGYHMQLCYLMPSHHIPASASVLNAFSLRQQTHLPLHKVCLSRSFYNLLSF